MLMVLVIQLQASHLTIHKHLVLSNSVQGGVIHTQVFNTSGVYRYDCSIGSHAQNGMMGAIFVNSPSSSFVTLLLKLICKMR